MQVVVVVHLEGQPRAQVTLAVFQTLQVLASFSLVRPREVGTLGQRVLRALHVMTCLFLGEGEGIGSIIFTSTIGHRWCRYFGSCQKEGEARKQEEAALRNEEGMQGSRVPGRALQRGT